MDIAGCCYYAAVHDWFRPPIREEDQVPAYLPIPAMAAVDVDHYLYHQQLQVEFGGSSSSLALPAPATAGGRHDEELLPMVPFSDIDLDAFDDVLRDADELHGSPPAQPQSLHAAVAPAAGGDHGDHFGTRSDASLDMELDATKQRAGPALVGGDQSLSVVVVEGYEMGVRYAAEHKLETTPPKKETPLPLSPPPRVVSRRNGAAPAVGKTRLDHIGFEDLRRFFYMPITRAAREMNVGLTVLKKRCRELGVARWPHRKMKSLRSLILNVQEMGSKGMSIDAMRRELAALETCCAMMEENPAVELTERTKKLRQACFKENYKRRREAAVDVLHHCFSFAAGHRNGEDDFFGY